MSWRPFLVHGRGSCLGDIDLETYPWYIVYGCYGSLLEENICDIGIYLRHILGI